MFYLKVEGISGVEAEHNTIKDPRLRIVRTKRVKVTALTDNLYSFFYCVGPTVMIGESLTPLSESEATAELAELDAKDGSIFLDSNIVSLAIVNTENGWIKVQRNASCNRPVYFCDDRSSFICSSSLRQMKNNGTRLEINQDMMPEYLVYRLIMPPATLFKNIKYLPGGWELAKYYNQTNYSLHSMWDIIGDRPGDGGDRRKENNLDLLDTTIELLGRHIRKLAGMDEQMILLLSGGLDSSILGALCSYMGFDVSSISSGFHLITNDRGEGDYALSAADALRIDHRVFDVTPSDYLESLVDSISIAEEPIHHLQSAVLQLLFRDGVDASSRYLLCGEGADSLFCNTSHYEFWRWRRLFKYTDTSFARSLLNPLLYLLARLDQRFAYFYQDHSHNIERTNHFIWAIGAYGDIQWVSRQYGRKIADITANRRRLLHNYDSFSLMDKITLLSLLGEADETMKIWGKLAERHNKILVQPFTHPELVNYVMGIPWDQKAGEPKLLLKKVARAMKLPDEVITRPKRSFGFPVKYWAAPNTLFQPLADMAGEMFDRVLLSSLQSTEQSKAMILWSLINVYIWQKLFAENVSPDDLKSEIKNRQLRKTAVPV